MDQWFGIQHPVEVNSSHLIVRVFFFLMAIYGSLLAFHRQQYPLSTWEIQICSPDSVIFYRSGSRVLRLTTAHCGFDAKNMGPWDGIPWNRFLNNHLVGGYLVIAKQYHHQQPL